MVSLFLLLYACDGISMLVGTEIVVHIAIRRQCISFPTGLLRIRAIARSLHGNTAITHRSIHPSLLSALATILLLLRWRLAFHLLLEPSLGRLSLNLVGLSFSQNMLEPELCTFQVDFKMRHLSGVGTDAIALNIAFFLGVGNGFVEQFSLKAVL
jgi:hypothetical protein